MLEAQFKHLSTEHRVTGCKINELTLIGLALDPVLIVTSAVQTKSRLTARSNCIGSTVVGSVWRTSERSTPIPENINNLDRHVYP